MVELRYATYCGVVSGWAWRLVYAMLCYALLCHAGLILGTGKVEKKTRRLTHASIDFAPDVA